MKKYRGSDGKRSERFGGQEERTEGEDYAVISELRLRESRQVVAKQRRHDSRVKARVGPIVNDPPEDLARIVFSRVRCATFFRQLSFTRQHRNYGRSDVGEG